MSNAEIIRAQRWEVVRERALQTLQRYHGENPDERDELGRFSSTGGSGADDGRLLPQAPGPLRAQSIRMKDSEGINVEVLVNQREGDLIKFAREVGKDETFGSFENEKITAALRVMRDESSGNLYAWRSGVVHQRIEDALDWEVGDQNRDVWYLIGGRLRSDQADNRVLAEQVKDGIDPDTYEARKERREAARKLVSDWILQGRKNDGRASTSKYYGEKPGERDEAGRFAIGGGASTPSKTPGHGTITGITEKPGTISGKSIKGMPENATINSRQIRAAMDRGAFEFEAKPAKVGQFAQAGSKFTVEVKPKLTDNVATYKAWSGGDQWKDEPDSYYNPQLAKLVTEEFGEGLKRTRVEPKAGFDTEIEPLADKSTIYRGISAEEMTSIRETGEIKSSGEYNIGDKQRGLTYYTTDSRTAAAYANGFAPWMYKATFERPAYVVAVKRPEEVRDVPGTGEHEVGVTRAVSKDEIVAVWRGDAYAIKAGQIDLNRGRENEYSQGSGAGVLSSVVWSKVYAKTGDGSSVGQLKSWLQRYHGENPDERDEGGKFAPKGTGGSATGFVSPNVSNLSFNEAAAALNSKGQQNLRAAGEFIDNKLGITATNTSVIGAWSDGAENSMMVVAPGADATAMRAAMAMKGYLADQKSVLIFDPKPDGDAFMASFQVSGKAEDVHDKLLKDGLEFHTLEPLGTDAYRVHIYGSDQATLDAISKSTKEANVEFDFVQGSGEFLGTSKTEGSDREQRDDARRVYEETIQQISTAGQLPGRDLGEIWSQSRNYWGSLAEAKGLTSADIIRAQRWEVAFERALKTLGRYGQKREFREEDVNRDELGRFSTGGGAGASAAPMAVAATAFGGVVRSSDPGKELAKRWSGELETKISAVEASLAQAHTTSFELRQLYRMQRAVAQYERGLGDRQQVNFQYSDDDKKELRAAALTFVNPDTKTARIADAGGTSVEALTSVLSDAMAEAWDGGAVQVLSSVLPHDADDIKAHEAAGFTRGEIGGAGYMQMKWGREPTKEELEELRQRDEKIRAEKYAKVTEFYRDTAKVLDFDAGKISLSANDGSENFTLNGRQFKALGVAHTVNPDPRIQGTIKLYPDQMTSSWWDRGRQEIEGVTAHEIQHIKFQNALDRYETEGLSASGFIQAEGYAPLKAGDELPPEWRDKYPTYTAINDALKKYQPRDFAETDGVSNYSAEYWKQYESDQSTTNYNSAVHETLAEMAKAKYTTGRFPKHVLSAATLQAEWLEEPHEAGRVAATVAEGTERWRNLYNAVEKIYQTGRQQAASKSLLQSLTRNSADVIRLQRWQVAQARAMQTLQKWTADTFDEGSVSRDESGKFGGGGGESAAAKVGAESTEPLSREARRIAEFKAIADRVAKKEGVDPSIISVTDEEKQVDYAGEHTGWSAGEYDAETGKITLFANQIAGEKTAAEVAAHEIRHLKFRTAIVRRNEEAKAIKAEVDRLGGDPRTMLRPDARLQERYASQYPAFYAMQPVRLSKPANRNLYEKAGVVSDYSKKYWDAYEKAKSDASKSDDERGTMYNLAVNETLAEMAGFKNRWGKFPLNMGRAGATTQEVKDGQKLYRQLFAAIDKVYKL